MSEQVTSMSVVNGVQLSYYSYLNDFDSHIGLYIR